MSDDLGKREEVNKPDWDREKSLAVVGGALVAIEFMRDWSHHLVDDLESIPKILDSAERAQYIIGMKICFLASGAGAAVTAFLAAGYLLHRGSRRGRSFIWRRMIGTFSGICALFMAMTAIVSLYAWFFVAWLRISSIDWVRSNRNGNRDRL